LGIKKQCKSRNESIEGAYPDRPVVAVGAIVFKDDKVLLVLRGKPPSENYWAIPGGSVNLGETLQEAVEREIKEETGLLIKAGEPVFTFDMVEKDDYDKIRFHYVIVDLFADYISGEPGPGDDVIDARWISKDGLKNLNISPLTLKLLEKYF